MFFTRIGKVAAHLIFWGSLAQLAVSIYVALNFSDMESNRSAAARYLASTTSGEAMDQAIIGVLTGVTIGILCEISARLSRGSDNA